MIVTTTFTTDKLESIVVGENNETLGIETLPLNNFPKLLSSNP